MNPLKAAGKVAGAVALGAIAAKVAEATPRAVAVLDRGAAKLVRAGNERLERAVAKVKAAKEARHAR